jgi:imidazolonepropionase-like amidohydrolase
MSIFFQRIIFLVVFANAFVIHAAESGGLLAEQVLIKNVRVWDGEANKVSAITDVLIEKNLIKKYPATHGDAHSQAKTINGSGSVLIPGLIEAHQHLAIVANLMDIRNEYSWDYVAGAAAKRANDMLMRGFTSVRDVGGPVFGIKRLIDEGRITGPRIYPSGAFISQTSGHADFRNRNDPNPSMFDERHFFDKYWTFIADGVDAVTIATRENLRNGATQIKLMAGGGVTSTYDPLDGIQYNRVELEAAVEAAENWRTYVTVHAYRPDSIKRALDAGVKCIEHGLFIDESTIKTLKKKGAFLVPQAQLSNLPSSVIDALPLASREKYYLAKSGNDNAFRLAAKHKVKVAFGTDLFGPEHVFQQQNLEFGARLAYFTSLEILKQATVVNAELLALSGTRNPYLEGALGVIKEGAYADLLLVNGDPTRDIKVLEDFDNNLLLIMKDGKVYKNLLD